MKTKSAILSLSILMLVGFSACKSSKNATSSPTYKPSNSAETVSHENIPGMSELGHSLVTEAKSWIGTKYRFGGKDRDGVDCSGFVMAVYDNAAGIKIPRTTKEQIEYCKSIPQSKLIPGDLVFFCGSDKAGGVGHVGMYIGNGEWIHASLSRGVMISNLQDNYWTSRYISSGRVQELDKSEVNKKHKKPVKQSIQSSSVKPPEPTIKVDSLNKTNVIDAQTAVKNAFKLDLILESKIDSIYGN